MLACQLYHDTAGCYVTVRAHDSRPVTGL